MLAADVLNHLEELKFYFIMGGGLLFAFGCVIAYYIADTVKAKAREATNRAAGADSA